MDFNAQRIKALHSGGEIGVICEICGLVSHLDLNRETELNLIGRNEV